MSATNMTEEVDGIEVSRRNRFDSWIRVGLSRSQQMLGFMIFGEIYHIEKKNGISQKLKKHNIEICLPVQSLSSSDIWLMFWASDRYYNATSDLPPHLTSPITRHQVKFNLDKLHARCSFRWLVLING